MLRLSQAIAVMGTLASAEVHAAEPARSAASGPLEEIVVTATKRAENILSVPISIAAVTAEDIDRRGLISSEDYLRGIAGVSQLRDGVGQSIIIRGIETTPTNQNFAAGTTVATYFGETPTTNTAGLGGGSNVDLKLVDVERVEVLRGPQGTAFGNSSLGGAVRTIPVAPKLNALEGRVAAGYSVTSGSGGDNNSMELIGNIPLGDSLAVRAVGYRYEESGYYRGVAGTDPATQALAAQYGVQAFATSDEEIGATQFTGGRIAAVFQPREQLRFTLSHLSQETEFDGSSFGSTRAPYTQARLAVAPEHARMSSGRVRGVQDGDIDLSNLTMEYQFSWADLMATYSRVTSDSLFITPVGDLPASSGGPSRHREHSGEIRLATHLGGAWDFLGGVYAEDLDDEFHQTIFQYRTTGPAVLGFASLSPFMGELRDSRRLKQTAAFGEVSWTFLEDFTLLAGVRAYDYKRTGRTVSNLLAPSLAVTTAQGSADATGTSYRANLSYKPGEDAMLYAGWSQGFRLGKAQPGLAPSSCDVNGDGLVDGAGNVTIASTRIINSDEVDNYELGAKFALLERRLTIAADVYRIEWTGVPFRVLAPLPPIGCGLSYTANGGAARSEGIDLQATWHLGEALRIDMGGSLVNAELTRDAPHLIPPARSGDRLPGSPEVNGNLGLQYEFEVAGREAFVRFDTIYVGSFYGRTDQPPLTRAGDYVEVDASAGVTFNALSVDLFVRNLTDEDAFTLRQIPRSAPFTGFQLRPRTIGLQLSYRFDR